MERLQATFGPICLTEAQATFGPSTQKHKTASLYLQFFWELFYVQILALGEILLFPQDLSNFTGKNSILGEEDKKKNSAF